MHHRFLRGNLVFFLGLKGQVNNYFAMVIFVNLCSLILDTNIHTRSSGLDESSGCTACPSLLRCCSRDVLSTGHAYDNIDANCCESG
ncbi:unnamed protein product [Protopolystoma xenopodis]|uniref:Uncharacterized protein n=1 Tax=Protopolystoma xenopodis TaxID=117903 RepID=A0A3S4ZL78_9PLAT|nr:unnamed protein product [Protopolystoma xenopodis]